MEMGSKKMQLKIVILFKLIMYDLLFTWLFAWTNISHLRIKVESEEIIWFLDNEVNQVGIRSDGPSLSNSGANRERWQK